MSTTEKPGGLCRVYCAGKISKNDWRHSLFPGLHHVCSCIAAGEEDYRCPNELPRLGGFEYCGPFFISCDHGCIHAEAEGEHGQPTREKEYDHGLETGASGGHGAMFECRTVPEISRLDVADACLGWVANADVVFAWIDDPTAYGSVAEVGLAVGLGKQVLWAGPPLDDMWLARRWTWWSSQETDAVSAFTEWAPRFLGSWLRRIEYPRYLATPHWQKKRAEALEAAGNRCQLCNSPNLLNVHHRTYERRGHELPSDLTVLCRPCHGKFHGKLP